MPSAAMRAALASASEQLRAREQDVQRLTLELEATNRGVLALYAELDDRAAHLKRADELKSRVLSQTTHEFRTPLHSILGLCELLEQARRREGRAVEPEVEYIRQSASDLLTLVNDLLDLAKAEAGRTVLRPTRVSVEQLLGTLRGILRPLLTNVAVSLSFEVAAGVPDLLTDEARVSQILRNLVSNALKATDRGEVRVTCRPDAPGFVRFDVTDTGAGIAPANRERIFEEFVQIEDRLAGAPPQTGTGLGLPLSRRLARVMGGDVTLESATEGQGSTFTLRLPIALDQPTQR